MNSRLLSHLAVRFRIGLKSWSRRLIFLAGGLTVGAAAVLIAKLADLAQHEFRLLLAFSAPLALVITPAGFGLAVHLSRSVFPGSQGSGIPQVIAASQLRDADARNRLVSLKIGVGKTLLVFLGLLCGASTGREGPTVQVGAAIISAFGRHAPFRQRGFLLAGGAAGVAAAFNTPLAGIVFGIEEMSRAFDVKTTTLILGGVIAAGLTSLALVGDYTYFGSTSAVLPLGRSWLVVPVCALVCGLAGGTFSRALIFFSRLMAGRGKLWIASKPVAFAALCGLGVALCGLLSGGIVYGTGYEEARAILHAGELGSLSFAPWKFLATLMSSISGIPGGIFAPSLAIGAGIGEDFTLLFQSVPVGTLALLGMVSYLTGVVQAPVTSFVIASEMTEDHAMIIPLMAAALIAQAASKVVCRDGLYHSLAVNFLKAESIARRSGAMPEPPNVA